MIIRGVNVFPTQIEEIVLANEHLSGQYEIHVSRDGILDEVEVHTELQPHHGGLSAAQLEDVSRWVNHRIKTLVGISTRVLVLAPGSLKRTEVGKAKRVFDRRPK